MFKIKEENGFITLINDIKIVEPSSISKDDLYSINRGILLSLIAKALNIDSMYVVAKHWHHKGSCDTCLSYLYNNENYKVYISYGWSWFLDTNFKTKLISDYLKENLLKDRCRLTTKLYFALINNCYVFEDYTLHHEVKDILLKDFESKYKID